MFAGIKIFGTTIAVVAFIILHGPSVVAANALVTLPVSTPGQRRVFQHGQNNIFIPTLPHNIAQPALWVTHIHLAQEIDIYFLENGRQPTLHEATVWSCANVQDRMVTRWYQRMFGLADPQQPQQQLSMGFDATNMAVPIITFAPEVTPAQQTAFWEMFKKIADNPVGRILLYRLLIEIRRTRANQGDTELIAFAPDHAWLPRRNCARSIQIVNPLAGFQAQFVPTNYVFAFQSGVNGQQARIRVNFGTRTARADMNDLHYTNGRFIAVTRLLNGSTPQCVYLFHEMVHWFHMLRHPSRYFFELQSFLSSNIPRQGLVSFYFGTNPIKYWTGAGWISSGNNHMVKAEEVRTVLGAPCCNGDYAHLYQPGPGPRTFLIQGDELSENLFRLAYKQQHDDARIYMRFGYDFISSGGIIASAARAAISSVVSRYWSGNWDNALSAAAVAEIFAKYIGMTSLLDLFTNLKLDMKEYIPTIFRARVVPEETMSIIIDRTFNDFDW
jgi:hypothetical protein